MRLLTISGGGSNSGKSTLILRLIATLPDWGVLKTSPAAGAPHDHSVRSDYDLVLDPARLMSGEKDTAAFLRAGAPRVGWLIGRAPLAESVVDEVRRSFAECAGLIVEGGSLAEGLGPARRYVVVRAAEHEVKQEFRERAARAEALLVNGARAIDDLVRLRALTGCRRALALDAKREDDPGTKAFLDEISAWARR